MKGLLFLLISLLTTTLHAQIRRIDTINTKVSYKSHISRENRQYAYSLGVKVFSIEEFPQVLNQVNNHDYVNTTLNGVYFKINDNQISYRISGTYYNKDVSFKNECEDCETATGKLTDISARFGFEKNFIYGIVQPYVAFETGYRRNTFEGNLKNASALNYTNPYTAKTIKNGVLLSPNLGLKFSPVSKITLTAETGIDMVYSYERQDRTYDDPNRTRTINKYQKWEFLLKPIGIASIQYNFGLAY